MAFCMCSVLSNEFHKKVHTLVLGGEAGRVKLTKLRVLECFYHRLYICVSEALEAIFECSGPKNFFSNHIQIY